MSAPGSNRRSGQVVATSPPKAWAKAKQAARHRFSVLLEQEERTITTYKVGYLVGSLATGSINRKLAKALIKLSPPTLAFSENSFREIQSMKARQRHSHQNLRAAAPGREVTQMTPWARMASATRTKPAMFAPRT